MSKVNPDFTVRGVHFYLSDNRVGISKVNYEFFPKYKVLMHVPGLNWKPDEWHEVCCVNTKKEAIEYIESWFRESNSGRIFYT